jgi:hypothetical protein
MFNSYYLSNTHTIYMNNRSKRHVHSVWLPLLALMYQRFINYSPTCIIATLKINGDVNNDKAN